MGGSGSYDLRRLFLVGSGRIWYATDLILILFSSLDFIFYENSVSFHCVRKDHKRLKLNSFNYIFITVLPYFFCVVKISSDC